MGMFDEFKCKYHLPLEGANALDYQTKDTPAQYLDNYELREDGTLWHEEYEIEDQSDLAKWKAANPGQEPPESLDGFCASMARVNRRWQPMPEFIGEIRFYTMYTVKDGKMIESTSKCGWLEWSAYFEAGKLSRLNLLINRPPETN